MFTQLLSILAPVYVCVGLGYGWIRMGRRFDTRLITELIAQIGAPCLIFSSLARLEVARGDLLEMAWATVLATAGFTIGGWLLLAAFGLRRTTWLAPIVFGNTGNMGLPICLFAFGEEGLALGVCFFATAALLNFTVGQWMWSGRTSLRLLLTTPLTWSVGLAAVVLWFEVPVPLWIERSTTLLGSFTIPLMAFTLGVTLGQLRLAHLARSIQVALARLVLILAVGLLVAWMLGLSGVARGVFLIDCAMPPAVINYLLAEKYDRQPVEVAGLVVVATLIGLVTLPFILAWVL